MEKKNLNQEKQLLPQEQKKPSDTKKALDDDDLDQVAGGAMEESARLELRVRT